MDFKVCVNTGCIRSTQYTLSVRFVFNMEKGVYFVCCQDVVIFGSCVVLCRTFVRSPLKKNGRERDVKGAARDRRKMKMWARLSFFTGSPASSAVRHRALTSS